MNYQNLSVDTDSLVEYKEIEFELKRLWEKIQKASEIINTLKVENKSLKTQNLELQQYLEETKLVLSTSEQELARLRAENSKLTDRTGSDTFSPAEKEALKKRINELITKINSHI